MKHQTVQTIMRRFKMPRMQRNARARIIKAKKPRFGGAGAGIMRRASTNSASIHGIVRGRVGF